MKSEDLNVFLENNFKFYSMYILYSVHANDGSNLFPAHRTAHAALMNFHSTRVAAEQMTSVIVVNEASVSGLIQANPTGITFSLWGRYY